MTAESFIKTAGAVVGLVKDVVNDDGITKFINGTYSDGTPRSAYDAKKGEYLSPKQKKKMKKKRKKRKRMKFKL